MQLKGLNLLDPSAARLITKLLNKDPAERWTAEKCLSSNFFQLKEDTTKANADAGAPAGASDRLPARAPGRWPQPRARAAPCGETRRRRARRARARRARSRAGAQRRWCGS
jgi:hypothetical protein